MRFTLLFTRQNNSIFCLVAQTVDVVEILEYEVRLIRPFRGMQLRYCVVGYTAVHYEVVQLLLT